MTGQHLVVEHASEIHAEPDFSNAQAILDALSEGATAALPRLGASEAPIFLGDVASLLADLAAGAKVRGTVRAGGLMPEAEPRAPSIDAGRSIAWEIGIERAGRDLLISIFQGGPVPEVALHERRDPAALWIARVSSTLRSAIGASANDVHPEDACAISPLSQGAIDDPRACAIAASIARLDASLRLARGASIALDAPTETAQVMVEPTGDLPIVMAAELAMRAEAPVSIAAAPPVLRSDLLSLLVRGKLRVTVGGHTREINDVLVFLLAEQLVGLVLDTLDAATRGRPYYRRITAFGAVCGVRLGADGSVSLTLGSPSQRRVTSPRSEARTFPAVDPIALARAVLAFGRALVRSLIRRSSAQSQNLRLSAFRGRLRELSDLIREATRDDSKINTAPELYRAFAAASRAPVKEPEPLSRGRLRFTSRWIATVPGIDLRATFLCGDRIVLGTARDLVCLDRETGTPLFRRPVSRAVSVMTPAGVARLDAEGRVDLHDLRSGETLWSAKLAPKQGAGASGVVVGVPGLPRMLIVSEGARHLAAVDLGDGEVKWRWASRRRGNFKLRRAGKLVIVASGDASLTALDVATGEVVWRFCDRLRFASAVAIDGDTLAAIAGGGAVMGKESARLHLIDPWSGKERWSVEVPAHVAPVGAPMLAPETIVLATQRRGGMGLVGYDRRTGELRFDQAVCSSAASCLLVDGTVVVNSEGGELAGISASDGATRYRHVFAGGAEGDRPRRLEPVLRSGALFVPQSEVHVVRPHEGTLLGRVPNDLIPDLLRVDERCGVYVAEESGHIAAYAAAARLSVAE